MNKYIIKNVLKIGILIAAFLISSILIYFYCINKQKADRVYYGNIYTGIENDKIQEAIAIKDDKIVFVGSKKSVKKYIDKNTKEVTYDNGLILSGFTDTHTHITPYFATEKYQMNLTEATTLDEYIKIITDYVNNHPNYDMYLGRGWNYMLFEDGVPTKDILDKISPDKPIFIKSDDGHACWINSKMIEKIKVTKDTKDPIGGRIMRDSIGNPVGCFRDAAMDVFVKPYLEPYTVEQYKELIMMSQNYYAEMGYSSYIEVFVEADNTNYNIYKAYEELDKENKLILRVQGAWNVSNNDKSIENVKKIISYKNESKGGMFELTDVKIFMDGVAETGTAYLSEPYNNNINNYGADRWPSKEDFDKLIDIIVLANKNDMVVHFHAIGDAAITKTLDALEEARKEYISDKVHNVITHLEVVKESDMERFSKLDVVIAADLAWGCKDDILYSTVEVKYLGEERASKAYPYKSVLDSGAVLSLATDYPAGGVVSPIAAYLVAINRNSTDDEKNVRDASQKMTIDEALRSMTYGGAYQMRQEKFRGTLKVGNKADLIVLNNNIIENHTEKDISTKVLLNIVNGKIVYKNN